MSPLFPYAHLFRAYVPVGSRLRSAPPPRGATRNRRKGPPPAFPPRPSAGPPPSAPLPDGRCGALRRSPSPLFRLRVDMSLDRLQIGRKRPAPLLAIEQPRDPDRKSTRLNSSHYCASRMRSSAQKNKHNKTH